MADSSCLVDLWIYIQDGNWAGQPKADLRPKRSGVGFGQLFSKNHLTQTQPNPTWKLIRSGLGRWFNHWVMVWSPKKVPDPLKSAKITGFVEPDPTQPNPNPKPSKTGLGLGSKCCNLTRPNSTQEKHWVQFAHTFLAQTWPVYILNLHEITSVDSW
jgi:hypothetical protein